MFVKIMFECLAKMFRFRSLLLAILVGYLAISAQCQTHENNVLDFGAVGDGHKDDTNAFQDAWEATCRSQSNPTMYIPGGSSFLLQPVIFSGPCLSDKIDVVINGTLIAPADPLDWTRCDGDDCGQWIAFKGIDGLNIYGSGTINPRGKKWWTKYCTDHTKHCPRKTTGFVIASSTNVHIHGLKFKDSPQMHIAIERSTHVHISNLTIVAPHDSPNTDGIHLNHAKNVIIEHTQIATGDDCISIGGGTYDIKVQHIHCGPGHGISVGSLGKHGSYDTVEKVRVRDVVFKGSTNGVRIKTWQGGRGYVRDVAFEGITSENAQHPIIIDQYYCDHEHCTDHKSAVQISDITYSHVRGTSDSKAVVNFMCSKTYPCKNINMNDINIRSTYSGKPAKSSCSNVVGSKRRGTTIPSVPCLKQA